MTPKEIKNFLTTTCFILTRKELSFLVMSAFETDDQPGTFKWSRIQCETCPFIHNVTEKFLRIQLLKLYLKLWHAVEWDALGQSVRLQGDKCRIHQNLMHCNSFNLPHCSDCSSHREHIQGFFTPRNHMQSLVHLRLLNRGHSNSPQNQQ